MAKIQTYEDMEVKTLWSTPDPGKLVRSAITNTMADLTKLQETPSKDVSKDLLMFLFDAEHSSVVEHACISFKITGVSRSFLAQITRHRMGSFTSSSQHYQDYSDYPLIVGERIDQLNGISGIFDQHFKETHDLYDACQENDIPKEEARQVLPNACAVNLIWTVNARSLYNFMRLRMCYRNVKEIQIFARKVWVLADAWWPELAWCLAPPCYHAACNQGKMSCGKKWTRTGTL